LRPPSSCSLLIPVLRSQNLPFALVSVAKSALERLVRMLETLKREDEIDAGLPSSWVVANMDTQIWLAWSEVAAEPVQLLPREAHVKQSWLDRESANHVLHVGT